MRKIVIKRLLLLTAAALVALIAAACALVWDGLHDHLGHADAALVLGNTVLPDGTPSARLRTRLDRTLELYHDGYFTMVIVSGAHGKEGFDEATVMKNYLIAHGIPSGQIIADNDGTTTFASAKNAARILQEHKFKSVLVVSQYFHIPRSKLALRKSGITEVYSAHAHYFEARDIYSIVRELAGYASYEFRKY